MRSRLNTLFCVTVILSGCAGTYRPVRVNNLANSSVTEDQGIAMQYKYDVLREAGNKKYAKKELKKNIRLVAVELTNNSDRPVNFKEDIEIYSGNRMIIPLEPAYAKKELKQIAPLYLLWSLLWVTINKCDDQGDCSSTPIPVGAAIGVINTAIAAGANKNLGEELIRYNLLDKVIEPGQTVSGIISIAIESGQPLELRIKE